jgi:hypothetical protein
MQFLNKIAERSPPKQIYFSIQAGEVNKYGENLFGT